MFVWPCAVALSEYVWQQRSRFLHQSVIEVLSSAGDSLFRIIRNSKCVHDLSHASNDFLIMNLNMTNSSEEERHCRVLLRRK